MLRLGMLPRYLLLQCICHLDAFCLPAFCFNFSRPLLLEPPLLLRAHHRAGMSHLRALLGLPSLLAALALIDHLLFGLKSPRKLNTLFFLLLSSGALCLVDTVLFPVTPCYALTTVTATLQEGEYLPPHHRKARLLLLDALRRLLGIKLLLLPQMRRRGGFGPSRRFKQRIRIQIRI